jgi:hypothetical protein
MCHDLGIKICLSRGFPIVGGKLPHGYVLGFEGVAIRVQSPYFTKRLRPSPNSRDAPR